MTAIQEALDGFAQYHVKNAKPGRHDEGLASSLRDVQRRFGLKPDGVAKPGGPTEFLLNAILAGGVTALAPDTAKAPDRGTFRQRLLIRRPVGEGAGNDPDDEAVVRHGLTLLGDLPFGAVVPGNRLEARALGDAIERFHRRRGLSQGRQVKPGSPAAVTFAKELGIAYADKLPEAAAPVGRRDAANQPPGTQSRPHRAEDRPSNTEMREKPFTEDILELFDEREDRGRWDREDRTFYNALRDTLIEEKGWNARDGGTWRGIAQNPFYTPFKKREHHNSQFRDWPDHVGNLTEDQVILLYRQEFWKQPKLDRLLTVKGLERQAPNFIAQIFDFGVNSKPQRAVIVMQQAINQILAAQDPEFPPLEDDGIIGTATVAALQRIVDLGRGADLNDLVVNKRLAYLDSIPGASDQGGWFPRAEKFRVRFGRLDSGEP